MSVATKVYCLLDHMKPDVPIYQHLGNGQRVKYEKWPQYRPQLRATFMNENGENTTIRFKEQSRTIDFYEQIEKEKIPANEKFTQRERDLLNFDNGFLVTNNPIVQKYVESYPQFQGFKGTSVDMTIPIYKIYDPVKEQANKNDDIRLRLSAMNKVMSLGLEDAQGLLIRLTNSFYNIPSGIQEVQNALVALVDDYDEKGLIEVLKEDNFDDDVNILIGKAVTKGVLSFDAIENAVARKTATGEWNAVKDIPSSYPLSERKRYFAMFITSEDGKLLLDGIKDEVEGKSDEKKERKNKKIVEPVNEK